MGLFGRPSETLIQSFRDALRDVVTVKGFAIANTEVGWFRYKPHHFQWSVEVAPLESYDLRAEFGFFRYKARLFQLPAETVSQSSDLHFAVHRQSGIPSTIATSEQTDLRVFAGLPCRMELALPEPAIADERLISAANVPVLTGKGMLAAWQINPIPVALITPANLEVRRGGLDLHPVVMTFPLPVRFAPVVKWFSFSPTLKERPRPRSGDRTASRASAGRIQGVKAPEPPPTLTTADLQERLRWILTPPIHEVLSDPALALPFPPRPYQTFGVKWLYDRQNALLADEMGLGKTMQAIIGARVLWRESSIKQILVICPKPLISNWRQELQIWWPDILPYTKVVDARDRQWFLHDATKDLVVKIINYEAVQRELDWLKTEKKPPYHDLVIIDEAQRIKNPESKSAQSVKALQAGRRWALTGTPLENSTDDVASVFGFVFPGLIKGSQGGRRKKQWEEEIAAGRMKMAIGPYMLRRRQEDVLQDLPKQRGRDVPIELGRRQREAYDRAELLGVGELENKGDRITITHVFALINALRQICNVDPASGESAKADLLLEELEEIIENGRKVLIFGQFVDDRFGLKRLARAIASADFAKHLPPPLEFHGGVPANQRDGILKAFRADPAHHVLLLNYRVGGVGLNLHAANYVYLFDRWWNPAVEDQAIKRAHRLGQEREVFVSRFYCKNTIEERILTKLQEKRRLFNLLIDDGRPAENMGLSEEEVFALFNLTVRPRRPAAPR